VALLIAERHERIDARRAARRDVAGEQRDERQRARDRGECQRIASADAEEQCADDAAENERDRDADGGAGERQRP
jgi:hypothetical protein